MGEEHRYVFTYMCTRKKFSWIHKKLAKLIAFRRKIGMTGRLSLYTHMCFMNHENALFTTSIGSRRKGTRKIKREKQNEYYTGITECPSS